MGIVGMGLMASICFVASVVDLFHGHYRRSIGEFAAVFFCAGMAYIGYRALRAIPILFDKLWPDYGLAQSLEVLHRDSRRGHE